MSICSGCGGVLGRDCWNEHDCVMIGRNMDHYSSFDEGRQYENDLIMGSPIHEVLFTMLQYRYKKYCAKIKRFVNYRKQGKSIAQFIEDETIPF